MPKAHLFFFFVFVSALLIAALAGEAGLLGYAQGGL
jgi:hypothetical protein